MRNLFRRFLKNNLSRISHLIIKKHGTEIILVVGWTGSAITKDLIYEILKTKYNVRRNISKVWWDLSVPLCILGYDDTQRNIIQWIILITKAYFRLLLKPKYPHKLVINLDTIDPHVADFWIQTTNPNIVVILREKPNRKMLKLLEKRRESEKIIYVYNPELYKFSKSPAREFIYGKNTEANLKYSFDKNGITFDFKNKRYQLSLPKSLLFIKEYIAPALSVGILEKININEAMSAILSFSIHPNTVDSAIKKLKRFVHYER